MEKSDEYIMIAVSSGKVDLLSELYQRYSKGLYNYFIRLNNSRVNADDMVQNVFEKLLKYSSSYTEEKKFKPWLFTIARNVNTDFHRKRTYEPLENVDAQKFKEGKTAFHEMVREERASFLRSAIAQLEPTDKELILLSKFEKLKYAEIADLLEINENAVKVKIHRAMKRLRTIVLKDDRYE